MRNKTAENKLATLMLIYVLSLFATSLWGATLRNYNVISINFLVPRNILQTHRETYYTYIHSNQHPNYLMGDFRKKNNTKERIRLFNRFFSYKVICLSYTRRKKNVHMRLSIMVPRRTIYPFVFLF